MPWIILNNTYTYEKNTNSAGRWYIRYIVSVVKWLMDVPLVYISFYISRDLTRVWCDKAVPFLEHKTRSVARNIMYFLLYFNIFLSTAKLSVLLMPVFFHPFMRTWCSNWYYYVISRHKYRLYPSHNINNSAAVISIL